MKLVQMVLVCMCVCAWPGLATGQARPFPLRTLDGLTPHQTLIDTVTFKGLPSVRVRVAPVVTNRADYATGVFEPEALVHVNGIAFTSGDIEVDVASAPAPGASAGARGFAGIAFRVQSPSSQAAAQTYDAFYLRPTNGRADDQERRNHAVQYISHPDWTWSRMRRETPSRYEAYVDLEPDTWTHIRIEVRGPTARLFVHGQSQPTLIVNDLKTGGALTGGVALWIGPGTVAHFRSLVVTPR